MTTRSVGKDEWYPVFTLDQERGWGDPTIDLPDAEIADYERVMREFNDWQRRLGAVPRSSHKMHGQAKAGA